MTEATIEWFGATTYRLRACGLTIFLDTWLERPPTIQSYLRIDDVDQADVICISHSHFDHIPGCDRLAKRTGAIVIGNGEAINVLRNNGVPDDQLLPISGGERIPLFSKKVRDAARKGEIAVAPGVPGAPTTPDHALAAMSVHVWPSLHCLLPGSHKDIPDTLDTKTVYNGSAPYACTIDMNHGMKHGLFKMDSIVPAEHLSEHDKAFLEYIRGPEGKCMSTFDGGQMMYSFQIEGKTMMWNGHLGGYRGILQNVEPKPDVLILGIAGRANIDGRPFDGNAAQAALEICRWLGEPSKVIWCLHDEAPIKPFRVDVTEATRVLTASTRCKVVALEHAVETDLFRGVKREECPRESSVGRCTIL